MQTHRITIDDNGEVYPCSEAETPLVAMARSGRRGIPLGCRGGGCGVCKVAVLAGDFSRRAMSRSHVSADEEREGVVLACCIYPAADLRLKVIGKMNRAITRAIQSSPAPAA